MVDASSGWVEIAPLLGISPVYVAHAFLSQWVCRFGLPKAFLSDNGPEFLNAMLNDLLRLMRV